MDYSYKPYDDTDPISIETYAQRLIGKTFQQVCDEDVENAYFVRESDSDYMVAHENKNRKGGLGEIIEERFFHYPANSDSRPDFPEAGVELKVTPYKINKNGSLSAKERLIITMIDYFNVINEPFYESHLWNKSRLILLIYYLYQQEVNNRLDYRIDFAKLFSPPQQDLIIIKNDYEYIVGKIRAGKAHELSEGDTMYLGAAPKAATSVDRRPQPFSDEPAKPRAFAFKNSYMTYVLNKYIVPGETTYEPIIKDNLEGSFENYVVTRINRYKDYTVKNLCEEFTIEFQSRPKNLESMLAFRMLGVKGNQAEEFVKANIVVKSIRIGSNGKIKESMSFPTFKFKEIVKETWEESTFGRYLEETKFLFVVYRFDDNEELRLKGCQFWNIPYSDLQGNVREVWEKTKQVIDAGLVIERVGNRNTNNFPKASDNPICHVRPHAQNSNDVYELPDGRVYPKQCFWLNNSYILSQIKDELKN